MTLQTAIKESKETYYRRKAGDTELWSASTKCIKCGSWWLWGVLNNLDFTCPNCINHPIIQ